MQCRHVIAHMVPGLIIPVSDRIRDTTRPHTAEEFSEANWGTLEERDHARKEFERFVIHTWEQLVYREKPHVAGTPSTALFCRMDVGVIVRNGQISYFVNEVERALTTSLWMDGMPDGLHGIFADTFGVRLHEWISGIYNPRHL
jgi:hypothetical protein